MKLLESTEFLLGVAISAIAVVFLQLYAKSKKTRLGPYPPGPRPYPLLGNLFDIPTKFQWETYARLGKELNSDILYLYAAGRHLIVLNSFEAAVDLLDKKSAIYSSRTHLTMISELMGYSWFFASMEYGKKWKERRRLFQTYFSNRNVGKYQATQRAFVRRMLPQLLKKPQDFIDITGHMVGGSTISLTYGLDIKNINDPFVDLSNRAIESVAEAGTPGAFLVDIFPLLKYVPRWMPGAAFKKKARIWRKLQEDVYEMPFAEAVTNRMSGRAKPSFVSESLERLDEKQMSGPEVTIVKDTAATVFAAGSDTTLSAIHSFFVAMLYFPEVQRKAQQELDSVLKGRLPDFGDEDSLPYIGALVKEVLRWKPIAPLGVPHYASEDDVYRGYFIPKGAVMITNLWAILHNEEQYPAPHIFDPQRYMAGDSKSNTVAPDPAMAAFGFGRRLCPGRHVATSLLWLSVATILSTFDISKPRDEEGVLLDPSIEYHSGMILHPLRFKCTLRARSNKAEALILSLETD